MAHKDVPEIHISEDGSAIYERRRVIEREGAEPVSRLIESKRVLASSLIPERGKLVLLPPNCCFHYAEADREVFVIQDTPQVRTVYWQTMYRGESPVYERMRARVVEKNLHHLWKETRAQFTDRLQKQGVFQLSFPYMLRFYLFIAGQYDRVTMWYRSAPLASDRDDLFVPNLPNRDTDGRLCITDDAHRRRTTNSTAETIMFIEKEFWSSPWTDHWTENFVRYTSRIPELSSPWEWEYASKADPLFILRAPWIPEDRTVADEVRRLLSVRAHEDNPARVFGYFEQRIRAADPWDGTPPKAKESPIEVSGARSLLLKRGTLTLTIGDKVLFRAARFDTPLEQPFEIEWFSHLDRRDNTRAVKLAGLEVPRKIIIGDMLDASVIVVETAKDLAIMVGETEIGPGSLCTFSSDCWSERSGIIERVSRGARGAIHAAFKDSRRFIIGEGEKFFPGVKVFPLEKTDPATGYSLASIVDVEGQTYSVGESIYRGARGTDRLVEFVIKAFFPLQENGTRACVVNGDATVVLTRSNLAPQSAFNKHESVKAGRNEFKVGDGIFEGHSRTPKLILGIMEAKESQCFYFRVDETLWISVGSPRMGWNEDVRPVPPYIAQEDKCTLGHVTFLAGETLYQKKTGQVFKIDRFLREEVGMGAVSIQAGSKIIPFINHWDFCEEFQQVFYEYQFSKKEPMLRRGMRIRMVLDTAELKASKRLVISHLIQKGERMAVVVTTGHVIPIDQGYFEAFVSDTWHALRSVRTSTRSTVKKFFPMVFLARAAQKAQRRFGKPIGTKLEGFTDVNNTSHYIGAVVAIEAHPSACHYATTPKMQDFLAESPARVVFSHGQWLYVDTGVRSSSNTAYSAVCEMGIGMMLSLPEHLKNDKDWWSRIVLVNAALCRVNRLTW